MKEMVGGCCVCSDDRGWAENPLVYCDGQGCNVAVHQACYGIVTVPTGNWYCRKCESPERTVKRCELCPSRDGALKPTDNNGWAHVVCALYIPEVRFGNVTTMEPIILAQIPQERYNKSCYICEEGGKGGRAGIGACMQCNKAGCRQQFHVTCAQGQGLLCEEAGNYLDNVKYCGYCHHHYTKLKKGGNVKTIPPYRPVGNDSPGDVTPQLQENKVTKRKLSSSSKGSRGGGEEGEGKEEDGGSIPSGQTQSGIPQEQESARKELVTKKKKGGGKTPPRASPDPASSPRPLTPGKPGTTVVQGTNPSPPTGNKPGAIVVQVPLEAAMGGSAQPQPHAASPPSADQPGDHPAKRARSQSSEKSEKGRRSKRGAGGSIVGGSLGKGGGGNTRGSQPTPPPPPPTNTPPTQLPIIQQTSLPPVKMQSPKEEQLDLPIQSKTRAASKIIKEEKDVKVLQNGVTGAPHMLGNQLNPSSTMAQKMCDTLSQEVAAHSIFSTEPNLSSVTSLVGPQLPKSSSSSLLASNSGTVTNNNVNKGWGNSNGAVTWNSSIPQSLDQLLERQWEQGSQFLMEQAQHFDIASLLSCLHQLRAENAQLEDHVNSLLARRDHLLAVNARLAIPLVSPQVTNVHVPVTGTSVSGVPSSVVGGGVTVGAGTGVLPSTPSSLPTPVTTRTIVENGLATPAEQQYLHQRSIGGTTTRTGVSVSTTTGCYVTAPSAATQSSVVVRAPDPAAHRRIASSGGNPSGTIVPPQQTPGVVYSTNVFTGGASSQPSTSQQPQVVVRREGSEVGVGGGSSSGGGGNSSQQQGVQQVVQSPPVVQQVQTTVVGGSTGGGGGPKQPS